MIVDDNRGRDDEQRADDDVVIEVEGDAPPKRGASTAPKDDDAPDDLSALKTQVADANARAEQEGERATAAEKRAQQMAERARSEFNARWAAQEGMVDNAIAASQTDIMALNKDLADAIERGDVKAQVEINDKLMDAKINLRSHSGAKGKLTQARERMVAQAKEAATRGADDNGDGGQRRDQNRDQDPLAGYSPEARGWIEKWRDDKGNLRFLTDQKFFRKVIAGHEDALAEGYSEGSPEYFGYIEKFARLVSDDGDDDNQEQERVTEKPAKLERTAPRQSSAAAPPSRGNGDGRTRTDTRERIRLTKEQADFARTQTSLGATEEERLRNYGINLEKVRKNGELMTQRAS